MADTNNMDVQKNELQDRLASLGETFNSTKEFGLMGMLNSANERPSSLPNQLQNIESTVRSNTTSDSGDTTESTPDWIKAIEPINSSLRAITDTTTRELSSLRSELSNLRQPQVVQTQAEAEPADPVAQKFGQIEAQLVQTRMNNGFEKAKNALNSARNQYGKDFDYKDEELTTVWRDHIKTPQAAEGTNWDMYFKQQYNDRRAPRLESRLKELESQLEKAKQPSRDVVGDMASMPRGGRNGMPIPSRGPVNDFDEDVYRAASAKMGKRVGAFSGFNRYLVEEQNKKLLRTAS